LLLFCVSGRLAKTASQTGEVLLNGHRKTNLSYGIAVWTLTLSLEKASSLAFCPEIGLSLRTHLLHICFGILLRNWTLSRISLPQRTHSLHIWFGFLHRNWAFSLREPIFTLFWQFCTEIGLSLSETTSSSAILHRIQITNTVKFHILSFLTAS
jgi:hypothetical protein